MCILGDVAFTRKPIAHQNSEHGTVAACDMHARGQLEVLNGLGGMKPINEQLDTDCLFKQAACGRAYINFQ